MQTVRLKAESQQHKAKLANSYHELLEEFSSKELRTVGNYTLGRLIGKGSFGKVYLATHKLTNGSKVVLKSAKKDDSNLAREIHHHRQFLHPHIARLYEVIVTENLVWLVLEYCPGDELYNYLLDHGRLPVDKVQKIFAQLVGAVSHVHNLSCVHRDLKLENILLDKNENVKLCDFGFTREYEGKASYLQTFCGTVCYSAPEMLRAEKYAGEKVDVWSLGVILYALLCGELPFDDDDDALTRTKILTSEPKWPDHMPPEARSLIASLLSKRAILRPTLADVLAHPFLAEHAPQQQEILKIQQPTPFTTTLEKDTLQRMRSAGVDIDKVIEHVLARRCDALAGWWALLIEKEERKEIRKERKRKEREAEKRSSRRLSGTSQKSRLNSMARTLPEVDENGILGIGAATPRGRKERRSAHYPDLVLTDLPNLPENAPFTSPDLVPPPPPIEKDHVQSSSSSQHRKPLPPPKEMGFGTGTLRNARRRGSTLHLVASNHDLLHPSSIPTRERPRRRHQLALLNQLSNWKHWFLESTKRQKSPNKMLPNSSASVPNLKHQLQDPSSDSGGMAKSAATQAVLTSDLASRPALERAPSSYPTHKSITNIQRSGASPVPLTPRSSFRRHGSGLRSRKSTSSSVSSVRSVHHHRHTHSKASSTSSNGSEGTSRLSLTARSPHHSVKVLPATPTTGKFPAGVRVQRHPPIVAGGGPWNEGFTARTRDGSPGGLIFAKRKKNVFKGPMLNVTATSHANGVSSIASFADTRRSGGGHSRSASITGRRSTELGIAEIQEEDEDDIEEVEAFSPITDNDAIVELRNDEDEEEEGEDILADLGPLPLHIPKVRLNFAGGPSGV